MCVCVCVTSLFLLSSNYANQLSTFIQAAYLRQGSYPQHHYVQTYPPGPSPVQHSPQQQQQQMGPYSHTQRPQHLILDGREAQLANSVDPYQPSPTAAPTPQSPVYMYNRKPPPRYPYGVSQQGSPAQSPHGQYIVYQGYSAGTPAGFPAPGSVQGSTTPSLQGPPPYGAPNTPTDSGYYGSMPNVHAVPSPLNRGVCVKFTILRLRGVLTKCNFRT